jgi:hypothetical protein
MIFIISLNNLFWDQLFIFTLFSLFFIVGTTPAYAQTILVNETFDTVNSSWISQDPDKSFISIEDSAIKRIVSSSSGDKSISYDLGNTVQNGIFRFSFATNSIVYDGCGGSITTVKLSDSSFGPNSIPDKSLGIMFYSGNGIYATMTGDSGGALLTSNQVSTNTKYYVEINFDESIVTWNIFLDSNFSNLLATRTVAISSEIIDLQYIKIQNHGNEGVCSNITANHYIDDVMMSSDIASPLPSTCGITTSVSDVYFSNTQYGQSSDEQVIALTNPGTVTATISVNGGNWVDDTNTSIMNVDNTAFSISTGNFDAKTSLSSSFQEITPSLSSTSFDTFWQLQANLVESSFLGDLSQKMTFRAVC